MEEESGRERISTWMECTRLLGNSSGAGHEEDPPTTALIGAAASIPASKFKGITERLLQPAAEALCPHGAGDATRGNRSHRSPPPAVLAGRLAPHRTPRLRSVRSPSTATTAR